MKLASSWSRLLLNVALAAAAGVATLPAQARQPVHTPGTPPGIVLPPTTENVPPPPAWDGVAFKRGVVSVSPPLAAQAGV